MRHRFDAGSGLAGAAALLLFVSLFLHWYGHVPGLGSARAWDVFEFFDWALAALAVATIAGLLRGDRDQTAAARWVPWTALAAVLIVGSQIIDPPPAAHGASREVGAWLALAASLAMFGGGLLAAADVSVTLDVDPRGGRRRVPAVDRRGRGPARVAAVDRRHEAGAASPAPEPSAAEPEPETVREPPIAEKPPAAPAPEPAERIEPEAAPPPPPAPPADPDRTQPLSVVERRREEDDRGTGAT